MTTPADPGAFDLESYRIKYDDHVVAYKDVKDLIAAVEALRMSKAELAKELENVMTFLDSSYSEEREAFITADAALAKASAP